LLPGPVVHADLAATAALPATDEHGTAPGVEVGFAERERFVDAQPGAQSTTMSARSRAA